jgi:hypothetical protein
MFFAHEVFPPNSCPTVKYLALRANQGFDIGRFSVDGFASVGYVCGGPCV